MSAPTILIVEDERIIASDLAARLKRLGYSVSGIVSSGEAAIDQMQRLTVNLILMDLGLKGKLDGIETAKSIKERWDVPIVFLTAHADPDTLERARLAEPVGYLLKPYATTDLRTTLKNALAKDDPRPSTTPHSASRDTGGGAKAPAGPPVAL